MDQTDMQIIDRVLAGDTDAFAEIVARYQRRLYDLSLRLLGDPAEAEDIAQTAFIKMFSSLPSYKRELAFGNWAYTITLNLARNRLKRRAIISFLPFWSGGEEEDPVIEPVEAGGDPPSRLASRDLRSALDGAMAALPPDLKEAFVLFHLHKVPARDIAETLGVTPNAVSLRLFKARERLMNALSPAYPELKEGI
ncbi:MAG: RNA polymerase sigma factor [Elusimicrobia bacterium]|nr:RNA polymerase sigma factor [Elusimicrobiota bacterium]